MKENTHKHFKRHISPVYRFDCYKFWHTEYDDQCEGYKTATENIPGFFIKYIGECWYIFIQSVDQLNAVGFFRRPFVNHPVVLTLLGTWKGQMPIEQKYYRKRLGIFFLKNVKKKFVEDWKYFFLALVNNKKTKKKLKLNWNMYPLFIFTNFSSLVYF